MVEILNDYARYNLWSNNRLRKIILENEEKYWQKNNLSSFGSIGATVIHILWAEYLWLQRISNQSSYDIFQPDLEDGREIVLEKFINISTQFLDMVKSYRNEKISEVVPYNTSSQGTFTNLRADMILHCINHSTFHRGQVISMLRDYGVRKFESLDYIYFKRKSNNED